MKKNVVLNARKLKRVNIVKIDCKTLVFFTIAICGIIIGVFTTKNFDNDWNNLFTDTLKLFCISNTDQSFFNIFLKLFLPSFIIYVCVYIIGTCAMGVPILCVSIFSIGYIFGMVMSHYCIMYGFMGICYCALVYLPAYALTTASLIKCCCHCFDISSEIFFYMITGKGELKSLFKEYTMKHIFFLLPICIGAILGMVSFKVFADLFTFI